MSKIFASIKKRLYTPYESVAIDYQKKTGDKVIELNMAKIRPKDVAPIPTKNPKIIVWAIMDRTTWETVMGNENQFHLWGMAGFDNEDFDVHRTSVDGTKAIFRTDIYYQVVKDRLDDWVDAGYFEAYYPYNHQEFNQDGDPVDTTIKEFLSGNPEWEAEMEE
jgi:hypothetical protein